MTNQIDSNQCETNQGKHDDLSLEKLSGNYPIPPNKNNSNRKISNNIAYTLSNLQKFHQKKNT